MQQKLPGFLIIPLLFICSLSASSQDLKKKIESAYSLFEADPQLKYASASLTVLNAQTGEIVFSRNGNTGLAPASTLKTITSAAAFHLLGHEFSYQTKLSYTGTISASGILQGDLIITGSGDPTLGSWRYPETTEKAVMNSWVEAVKRAGIKKIEGRVLADDSLFGTQSLPSGWIWQDIGNYYGAGPSSLTWRENQFDIIFKAGLKPGDPVTLVKTIPRMPFLQLVNEVTTGKPGTGDNVYAYSSPYSSIVYLRGTYGIDLNKQIAASVPDPPMEAATRLSDTLLSCGISSLSAGTYRMIHPPSAILHPLSSHTSPNLQKIIYWFNQKSVNLYGEHLVKTIAWKMGKSVTTEEGAAQIKDFWNKKLGVDKNALNIVDGSGLSPGTRVTTMAMAQILASAKTEPWFASYLESFPVYNNMKAKSGSIKDVLAYTGYQTSSSGMPLVFSLILNNYNGSASSVRQKMFKVLDELK